jgi:hypothetical protein
LGCTNWPTAATYYSHLLVLQCCSDKVIARFLVDTLKSWVRTQPIPNAYFVPCSQLLNEPKSFLVSAAHISDVPPLSQQPKPGKPNAVCVVALCYMYAALLKTGVVQLILLTIISVGDTGDFCEWKFGMPPGPRALACWVCFQRDRAGRRGCVRLLSGLYRLNSNKALAK